MTASLVLDPKTTAFLFMDFQKGILPMLGDDARDVVARAVRVQEAARAAGALVVFVRVAFRPGYPEASDRNPSFAAIKQTGRLVLESAETQIVDELAPRAHEPVVTKHRVGAFGGTPLAQILRAHHVETLVLAGVSTSGVILSTVRHAADEDYRIVVIEDACADRDAEVHRVLMQKVFPRQASVLGSDAVIAGVAKPT